MNKVFCIYYRDMHTALNGLLCYENSRKAQYNYDYFIKQIGFIENEIKNKNVKYIDNADNYYASILYGMLRDVKYKIEDIDSNKMTDILYYGKLRKCYETGDTTYICVNTSCLDLYM